MEDLKISLDIRTILAQLNIDHERFIQWEIDNKAGLWENTEWVEYSEDSEQQAAATQS
jgi:hypothetical protein